MSTVNDDQTPSRPEPDEAALRAGDATAPYAAGLTENLEPVALRPPTPSGEPRPGAEWMGAAVGTSTAEAPPASVGAATSAPAVPPVAPPLPADETLPPVQLAPSGYPYAEVPASRPAPSQRIEAQPEPGSVGRGVLLAFLVVPVGIAAWVALWNAGFVASIVAFGIAWGALFLYRLGSRARVTVGAFWALIGITVLTLGLVFLAGIAFDAFAAFDLDPLSSIVSPDFWAGFFRLLSQPKVWESYAPSLGLAILFGTLGCFGTFRRMRAEPRA